MDSLSYDSLSYLAKQKDYWIDTQEKLDRAQGTGNTNKKERISRALSWYERSEISSISDERIIFAWTAFNALYSQHPPDETDREYYNYDGAIRREFFTKLETSERRNHTSIIFDTAKNNIEDLKK